jgi:hypothetical protein
MPIVGQRDGEEYKLEIASNQKTESDVAVAKDIIRMCDERGFNELAESIRIRYGLAETKHYNIEDSKFVQACRAVNISGNIQGHVHSGDEGAVRFPVIAMVEDVRKFEVLYEYIKNEGS